MEINVAGIVLTIIFSTLAWYGNAKLNTVPVSNQIVSVLIVVLAVFFLVYYMGFSGLNSHISVH